MRKKKEIYFNISGHAKDVLNFNFCFIPIAYKYLHLYTSFITADFYHGIPRTRFGKHS